MATKNRYAFKSLWRIIFMFTLNTHFIPALNMSGIRFRYIGGIYDPMTIIITHKNFDICRVDVNRDSNEPYNYNVYWFSIINNINRFREKYIFVEDLINDIRIALKDIYSKEVILYRAKEDKMIKQMYRVTDIELGSSPMDEINFTVNVARPCTIQEDADRIREAIESAGEVSVEYVVGGRGKGKRYSWRNEYQKERDKFVIKDVIFNSPATIVLWADGTKTVVKAENEPFDPEKGLAMAISKRALGDKYNYYDTFKKYVGRYQKKGGK